MITALETVSEWAGIDAGVIVACNSNRTRGKRLTVGAERSLAMIARSLKPLDDAPLPVPVEFAVQAPPTRARKPVARKPIPPVVKEPEPPEFDDPAEILRRRQRARRILEDRRLARDLGLT